ncbi:Putative bifunctional UDP-N-acetylglucosamine transferase and deubiquitinase ALG13 [Eumeta japonica]|uniref:UDP-N-acetylglucosamine transferase subunit ALG13 n=1 Tax=Eumeta variegata TaxID=151549 RepID=A0A4C1V8V1_EUMVA|nr:Putative bifunctional UDP-N-acetylglucosamine transferase and deubiquitinase ALG13 [Eumeta japonica]
MHPRRVRLCCALSQNCKSLKVPGNWEDYKLNTFSRNGCEELTVQIGNSDIDQATCEKDGVKIEIYRFKDSIQDDINNASLVISHAGAGSVLETLEAKKPLIVVVNEDLMDNHQLELAEQLQVDGHLAGVRGRILINHVPPLPDDRARACRLSNI